MLLTMAGSLTENASEVKSMASKKMSDEDTLEIVSNLFNDTANVTQQILERTWFRNILYYMGEQWFEWARSQNTFKKLVPQNYTPTPVANIIRDFTRSIKALILNKDYSVRVWPNSNDQDDRDASTLGEQFLRWMETRRDEDEIDEKEMTAVWMILCGIGFDRTFPDMDSDSWVLDASGNPISAGDVAVESISPFMVRVDNYGRKLRHKRYVGIKSLKPKEWVEDTFEVQISGTKDDPSAVNYERRLAHLVANVSPWKGEGIEMPIESLTDEDLVVFKEIEFKPTQAYPKGRYVIVCDDKIIKQYDRMPVQVIRDSKIWYYSLTDYHYNYVPGRYMSDSAVNDLISPQNTINQIDQDLEINRRGLGAPYVLVGSDLVVSRVSKYGQRLNVLKYDSFLSGGQKPGINQGQALPQQVLEERNIHRMTAQDSAGDPKNVLRGNAPSSQASGIMVDILRDAAEQGHLPDINRFYRSLKRRKRKQLIMAMEVYTEERLIKIPDRHQKAKVKKFKGTDLRNNTDVRLELSSGLASTRTGQTQLLMKLTETGFFNVDSPLDPEHREELMRRLGLTSFRDKRNVDVERASGENSMVATFDTKDLEVAEIPTGQAGENGEEMIIEIPVIPGLFLSMGAPQPEPDPNNPNAQPEPESPNPMEGIILSEDPLFKYDDHTVHYETHRRYILSPDFRALDPILQDFLTAHTDVHKQMMDVKMAEDAMRQGAVNMIAGGPDGMSPGGGGGRPPQNLPDIVPSGEPAPPSVGV